MLLAFRGRGSECAFRGLILIEIGCFVAGDGRGRESYRHGARQKGFQKGR